MAASAWRVEFDRAAVRDLRKLGADAQARVLRYLRERICGSEDPRRLGHALTGDRKDDRFIVLVVAVGHHREVYR